MSKELEAFERVWEDCSQLYLDYISKHYLMDDLREIKKSLTPPTVDEVCKALSEYHLFDMVEYDDKTQTFYSGDNICYMGIDCQDKPIIIFDYELPPHLITLIGRFYQSLTEELK